MQPTTTIDTTATLGADAPDENNVGRAISIVLEANEEQMNKI